MKSVWRKIYIASGYDIYSKQEAKGNLFLEMRTILVYSKAIGYTGESAYPVYTLSTDEKKYFSCVLKSQHLFTKSPITNL